MDNTRLLYRNQLLGLTCNLYLYTLAMFGNNSFGALGVESNQQAGPSRKQIQGEEIDVDVSCRSWLIDAS
jgi:hypothetical protein